MAEKTVPKRRRLPLRAGATIYGQRRLATGLSLREVEHRTGLNRGMLSMIERGRMIPTEHENNTLLDFYATVQSDPQAGDRSEG